MRPETWSYVAKAEQFTILPLIPGSLVPRPLTVSFREGFPPFLPYPCNGYSVPWVYSSSAIKITLSRCNLLEFTLPHIVIFWRLIPAVLCGFSPWWRHIWCCDYGSAGVTVCLNEDICICEQVSLRYKPRTKVVGSLDSEVFRIQNLPNCFQVSISFNGHMGGVK